MKREVLLVLTILRLAGMREGPKRSSWLRRVWRSLRAGRYRGPSTSRRWRSAQDDEVNAGGRITRRQGDGRTGRLGEGFSLVLGVAEGVFERRVSQKFFSRFAWFLSRESAAQIRMPNYLELPVGPKSPELVNAVIEIPYEGINKYEYDKQLHVFRLDRNLYSPVHYPGDYGFIPSTLADDGDPLDCLVLVDTPSFPGCVLTVRPIGVLEMTDQGVGDEKILCVGQANPRYKDVWNYSDVYPHVLKEMTHFFSIYKDLEGKRVEVKGWRDAAVARQKIAVAAQAFEDAKEQKDKKILEAVGAGKK